MPKPLSAGTHDRELFVGPNRRAFRLVVPSCIDREPDTPRPLVLVLHPGRTHGLQIEQLTGFSALAEREGFLVAYPDGSGNDSRNLTWNAGLCCGQALEREAEDTRFLHELIDKLPRWVPLDVERVYVCGLSNGGMMAQRLAIESPGLLAAVASVAGPLMTEAAAIPEPLPFWYCHGTADPMISFDGGPGPNAIQALAYRSVAETLAAWLAVNQSQPPVRTELPAAADDITRCTIDQRAAPASGGGAETIFVTIENGGHTWPGHPPPSGSPAGHCTQAFDATAAIWTFFQRHERMR
jgi:polyhydroxybutyrate depolymerase